MAIRNKTSSSRLKTCAGNSKETETASVRLYGKREKERERIEEMSSVSAGHIILTPTQTVGSGRPQRESNPGSPYQESSAIPTELPRPPSNR